MFRTMILATFFILFSMLGYAHQDPELAGYIPVQGGKIWYRLNGSMFLGKKPAIIVLHGGPGGTHRKNMPIVQLADAYPVILYDQLDSGNSSRNNNPEYWRVSRFVDEIDAIRSALNLDKVVVLGHSWGGTIAAEYALRNPKHLVAAILSSPLISTPQWIVDNNAWKAKLPTAVKNTLINHEKQGTTDSQEYLDATTVFYRHHMCRQDPCPGENYLVDAPKFNDVLYQEMWGTSDFYATGSLKEYDISQQLHQIKAPTLLICGEFDEAAPKSCEKYAKMINQASYKMIPNAGHATMRENETLYVELVRDFIDKTTAGIKDK